MKRKSYQPNNPHYNPSLCQQDAQKFNNFMSVNFEDTLLPIYWSEDLQVKILWQKVAINIVTSIT